jgi:hypothetical protein
MSDEVRGARPDVMVTVERLDVAAPRRGRRRRQVEGARAPRRDAVVLLAAAAVVVALLFAGAEARDALQTASARARLADAVVPLEDVASARSTRRAPASVRRSTSRCRNWPGSRGPGGPRSTCTAAARSRCPLGADRVADSSSAMFRRCL